jgi:hypothetical protein
MITTYGAQIGPWSTGTGGPKQSSFDLTVLPNTKGILMFAHAANSFQPGAQPIPEFAAWGNTPATLIATAPPGSQFGHYVYLIEAPVPGTAPLAFRYNSTPTWFRMYGVAFTTDFAYQMTIGTPVRGNTSGTRSVSVASNPGDTVIASLIASTNVVDGHTNATGQQTLISGTGGVNQLHMQLDRQTSTANPSITSWQTAVTAHNWNGIAINLREFNHRLDSVNGGQPLRPGSTVIFVPNNYVPSAATIGGHPLLNVRNELGVWSADIPAIADGSVLPIAPADKVNFTVSGDGLSDTIGLPYILPAQTSSVMLTEVIDTDVKYLAFWTKQLGLTLVVGDVLYYPNNVGMTIDQKGNITSPEVSATIHLHRSLDNTVYEIPLQVIKQEDSFAVTIADWYEQSNSPFFDGTSPTTQRI